MCARLAPARRTHAPATQSFKFHSHPGNLFHICIPALCPCRDDLGAPDSGACVRWPVEQADRGNGDGALERSKVHALGGATSGDRNMPLKFNLFFRVLRNISQTFEFLDDTPISGNNLEFAAIPAKIEKCSAKNSSFHV